MCDVYGRRGVRYGWISGLALAAAGVTPAWGQVQADDLPGEVTASTPVLTPGVSFAARFDRERSDIDADAFTFHTTAGHLYRCILSVSGSTSPIDSSAWLGGPIWYFPWANTITRAENIRQFVGRGADEYIIALGAAASNGSSIPYTITLQDLGQADDPESNTPGEAIPAALDQIVAATLTPTATGYWGVGDIDVYKLFLHAGRRYRAELLDDQSNNSVMGGFTNDWTATGWGGGWGRTVDPSEDGWVFVTFGGPATGWPGTIPQYRFRVRDIGPGVGGEPGRALVNAAPIAVGIPARDVVVRDTNYIFLRAHLAGHRRYAFAVTATDGRTPGTPGTAELAVLTADGHALAAFSSGKDQFGLMQEGDYLLRWRTYDAGTRRVMIELTDLGSYQDDIGDGPAEAAALIVDGPALEGVLNSADDVDVFMLTGVPEGGAHVEITRARPGQPLVAVTLGGYDSPLGPILMWEYGIADSTRGTPEQMIFGCDAAATTPTVVVQANRWYNFGDWRSGDHYTIRAIGYPSTGPDDWPDTSDGAAVLTIGGPAVMALRNSDEDVDVFLVDLAGGHLYDLPGMAELFNADGQPITAEGNLGGGYGWRVITPAPGRYALRIATGRYGSREVVVGDYGPVTDDHPAWTPMPKLLEDVPFHGVIDFAADVDVVALPLERGVTYRLAIGGDHLHVQAFALLGDAFTMLDLDTYSGIQTVDHAAHLLALPDAGPRAAGCALHIRSDDWWNIPVPYTVTLTAVHTHRPSEDQPDSMQDAQPLTLGVPAWGELQSETDADMFVFQAAGGHLYRVTAESCGFLNNSRWSDWMSLQVLDAQGRMVVSPYTGRVPFAAVADGPMYVRVSPSGWRSYALTVTEVGMGTDDYPAAVDAAPVIDPRTQVVEGDLNYPGDVDVFILSGVSANDDLWCEPADPNALHAPFGANPHTLFYFDGDAWFGRGVYSFAVYTLDPQDYPLHYRLRVYKRFPGDLTRQGGGEPDGTIDINDLLGFMDFFFAGDPRADLGSQGGAESPDSLFTNDDFIVYLDRFFAGCPW